MTEMFKAQSQVSHYVHSSLSVLNDEPTEAILAIGKKDDLSLEKDKGLIDRINSMILKIHRNSAHCNAKTLARVLKEDGAPDCVVQRALNLKCDFL